MDSIKCKTLVSKKLPYCEHSKTIRCSEPAEDANLLECGHDCAGVCGEICPSKDFCLECAPEKVKSQVPDMIINSTFSEVDWEPLRPLFQVYIRLS
ncbi:unnamed protein product [Rhizophagus irregularis]|nr:unnamed protein product [Rhizophagus irregularis]